VVVLNPSVILGSGIRLPALDDLDAEPLAPVNWVDLETVATAHASALESGRAGERYLIAGRNGELADLYRQARSIDGLEIGRDPEGASGDIDSHRYLLTSGRHLDATKASHVLGIE
jgi:dihydroflavonol-4-reductase